ncbi:MAG: hypothetical protein Q7V63_09870 [Gammaproteobacteria bacterium]|nr:hypothetical protein [Gammaproteobacteria bacterium]
MRSIKVISELAQGEKKALLLEFPQDMFEGLKIAADGTIDTNTLLGMLMMLEQEAALEDEELSLQEHLALMVNIFDESLAADFSNPAVEQ